ncbi:hypothetical protein [bacterium endosymbiont of Bathymodiolus sp. 5 South]|jgi:8-amino-7-oxononanoate synthase|uniref:hypothetical protein n=1 Tax=bacterium endosymbiont of Bathymodiolus sp. 5 South TaxID=1181670 RepID=UPI0010B9CF85|nr:hypothetical protein [bacterium endosymbiont of Bathymodiolus sp. 5 South]CAC9651486.1 8-amino-7-oxononanoate synthase (EC 2.3.1.47) [uncultured Gammaproteobacteria bacterium]SHN92803.1 8-amino-7-oxononanoate synthase [bacterium endosymbiont of Bathymodiolus sp. 5 South]SSC07308.1 8-amino-7-oxononanoate synthase [bacterium endosymbiont of Bathymodiolus sp. 5 South]VVH58929.1 8-amino-7-oxononanoate synthase (EC [uncultured Gammaproteobacteria bacterium]VVH63300.1 8-amino-7-oxononanoate synth
MDTWIFQKKLSSLKQSHLYRSRKISENTQLIINEQSLINFCSNDYLSLAKHPKIKQAFKQGIDKFSSGAGVHRT